MLYLNAVYLDQGIEHIHPVQDEALNVQRKAKSWCEPIRAHQSLDSPGKYHSVLHHRSYPSVAVCDRGEVFGEFAFHPSHACRVSKA